MTEPLSEDELREMEALAEEPSGESEEPGYLTDVDIEFYRAARAFVPRAIADIRKLKLAVIGELETVEFGQEILSVAREDAARENAILRARVEELEPKISFAPGNVVLSHSESCFCFVCENFRLNTTLDEIRAALDRTQPIDSPADERL